MLKVGRIFETVNQYEGNTSVGKRQDSSLKKHHKWSLYKKRKVQVYCNQENEH